MVLVNVSGKVITSVSTLFNITGFGGFRWLDRDRD